MKKLYILCYLFCFPLFLQAQIIDIPDANFKNALVNTDCADFNNDGIYDDDVDTNNDGEIQLSEAEVIVRLKFDFQNISSLEGINNFINLKRLRCVGNTISSLDLNDNTLLERLECGLNQLTELDLTYNTLLNFLKCGSNYISDLNISNNVLLQYLDCGGNNITTLELSNNTNLRSISCQNNNIATLDVSNLQYLEGLIARFNNINVLNLSNNTLIERIDIWGNDLDDLDISNNTALKRLNCHDNNLSNLDISNNLELENLSYGFNSIPWIDVSSHINLEELSVSGLNLSAVDISQNTNLTEFVCIGNQLTELDVSNNLQLEKLYCSDNELTSLNLNNNPSINALVCGNNPLELIYVKNESLFEENAHFALNLENNVLLEYICADEGEFDIIEDKLNQYNIPNCVITSNCDITPGDYEVSGANRLNIDNEGCEISVHLYPFLKFELETNNEGLGYSISNSSGFYEIDLNEGNSGITPILENPDYFNIEPSNLQIVFPAEPSPYHQDFCITPNGQYNDLEVILMPIQVAIPGFEANYKLLYKNKGSTILSGAIELLFNDDFMDFVSASQTVDDQSVGELLWNYTDILPFETRTIDVTMILNTPTDPEFPLNSDDILNFVATVNPISGDQTPEDNTFSLNQTVVNSFDPNDIVCLQGTEISEDEIGNYVHYRIRFENEGTANAINVVVKDVIDEAQYDITSLVPLDASHNFFTRVQNNNVEFIFENIQLPFDDANNDGYVLFKIKTWDSLEVGDTFSNQAEIYFDFNAPVITNSYTTLITEDQLGSSEFNALGIKVHPNPVDNFLNIESAINIDSGTIYDINGRVMLKTVFQTNNNQLDLSQLNTGVYFFKVHSSSGDTTIKIVKR